VKVPLPEGTRQGDVVKLKLTIDHNKILHWWYSVGHGEFTAASPFNDPWTPRQLEPSEKRLLAFRRQMADELAAQNQLSDATLLHEATLLRLAGHHDEAELALRDLVAEHGLTGRAANLLALVCGEQGNTRDELHYAEKAASLNPENATIVGNYGCVLAETGQPDQAIPKMRLALQADPELDYLSTSGWEISTAPKAKRKRLTASSRKPSGCWKRKPALSRIPQGDGTTSPGSTKRPPITTALPRPNQDRWTRT
jgi:tetratricopeptide (TPR) repeat protein